MNRYWLLAILLLCAVDCRVGNAQGPLECFAWYTNNSTVRAEGLTELVSDVLVICTGGTPVSSGAAIPAYDMKLNFNASVTSRILGSDGYSSEALMLIDEPTPDVQFPCELPSGVCPGLGNGSGAGYYGGDAGANRNVFQGAVSAGTSLLWKGIPFDPPGDNQYRIYRFTNIRLDATSLTGGATDLQTVSVGITGPGGDIPVANGALTLGTTCPPGGCNDATPPLVPSLVATVRDAADTADSTSGVTVGVGSAVTTTRVATLRFAGAFAGADRPRSFATFTDADSSPPPENQNITGVIYGAETGFYNSNFGSYGTRGNLGTAGLADSGTRYMAVINNIPTGLDVYVDVYNSTVASGPTARLISVDPSGAGPFVATPTSDGTAKLTVSGGKAVAIWEVLLPASGQIGQYDFGVYLSNPARSTAPTSTSIQMMYAPTGGHATPPTSALPVFDGTVPSQTLFTYSLTAPPPTPGPTTPPTPTPTPTPTPNPTPTPTPNPPPVTTPKLTVSPLSMSFSGTVGGQNPPAQFLQISTDSMPTGFALSASGAIHFQPLPPTGVTYRLVPVSVDLTGMAAGTFKGTLSVKNTLNAAVTTVAVTLKLDSAPQISSLSVPAVRAAAPGFTLGVIGSNFTGACSVRWNGTALATTFVSASQLKAQVPAALIAVRGLAAITVLTPDGAISNSVPLPVENIAISSLLPVGATAGDVGVPLTIAGSGFVSGSTITFGTTVLQASSVAPTQIAAFVSAALLAKEGTFPVSVTTPGGTVSNVISFNVAPVFHIDKLSPTTAIVGGPSFTLEISGVGFVAGTTVRLGTTELQPVSVAADKIVVTIPAVMIAKAGLLTVSALRPLLPPSNGLPLTVNAIPTITALNPASVMVQGPTFSLNVTGSDFFPGATIRWNGRSLPTALVSSTQMTAPVPAGLIASAGTALIDVSAGGGVFSNATLIRINALPAPTLNSASPAALTVGALPVSVTLSGSGFQPGCAVAFAPPSAAPVRVVPDSCSPTLVVVRLPAALLGVPGSGQIQVTNPDGLSSAPLTVELALPPFLGVSLAVPPVVLSGQDQLVTVALNLPYPVALQGTLTLNFTPEGNMPDDPAIQFQNGSRIFTFSVPAGTQPQIRVAMKSGTVAGQITIAPSFTASGQDVRTLPNVLAQQIQVARSEPLISLFTCTRTSAGIVAVVEGFTNTRSVTQAAFDLQTASGSQGTPDLGAGAPALFSEWFGSPQAAASGGLFRYTQPLTTQVDASKITSASVKLSNSAGTSATAVCQVQ